MTETPEHRPDEPAAPQPPVAPPPASEASPPVEPAPPVAPPPASEPSPTVEALAAAEPPPSTELQPPVEPPRPAEPAPAAPPVAAPAAVRVTPPAPAVPPAPEAAPAMPPAPEAAPAVPPPAEPAVPPSVPEPVTGAVAGQPAVPAPETDPVPPAGSEAEPATAGRRRRGLLAPLALGLLVVLLLVAGAFLLREVRENDQVETARREALAAARSHAVKLLSYDYRTLEKDFAAATAVTTGRFRSQYEETTTEAVGPSAAEYKVVVEADVRTLGVADASPDRVVVVAFINQTTTSTRVEGPKLDQNRVRLTLVEVDGRWLVSDVDAL